jgi:hypothetical protein
MNDNPYEYDVAFSFLADDEDLARQLNDLLQDRLSTFLYSQKQDEIAGTDGEETFNRVFGKQTRLVVVLHREDWGSTSWTRIEEAAIRKRAFDEGYTFVVFIPLEHPPKLPDYVPPTEIWIGLDRWGPEGAASAIEARVQQRSGSPRPETAVERAQRLQREMAAEEERVAFLRSQAGVEAAHAELEALFDELDRLATEIRQTIPGLDSAFERKARECVIRGPGLSIYVYWAPQYGNTLNRSALYVKYWDGPVSLRGRNFDQSVREIRKVALGFDRTRSGAIGWRESRRKRRFFSSAALADHLMKEILDHIDGSRSSGL